MTTQPQPQPTLLLIDGLNIVRRVYGAVPGDDGPEKVEGALKSSLASFRRALAENKPTHVLAAFDSGGKNWRHELWPDYRAARKPMPQELRDALPGFKEQLAAAGVRSITMEAVEADDVIATAAHAWTRSKPGAALVVVSNDKDLAQLMSIGALVRDHFQQVWRDAAWVQKAFGGVGPALLHDALALMGDSSDGVPGLKGVGPTTAGRWLTEHGGLEQLLAAADSVKGKAGETLRAGAEQVRLARKLVSFKTDIALGLTWNALRYQPPTLH